MKKGFLLSILILLASNVAICSPNLEPGMYNMTTEAQMPEIPGLPEAVKEQLKKQTHKVCIKESDLKNIVAKLNEQKNCKFTNVKETSTELTWKSSCTGQGLQVEGDGQAFLKGKSFSGTTSSETLIMGAKIVIKFNFNGLKIGACK